MSRPIPQITTNNEEPKFDFRETKTYKRITQEVPYALAVAVSIICIYEYQFITFPVNSPDKYIVPFFTALFLGYVATLPITPFVEAVEYLSKNKQSYYYFFRTALALFLILGSFTIDCIWKSYPAVGEVGTLGWLGAGIYLCYGFFVLVTSKSG